MVQRKAERAARDAGKVAIPDGGGAELPGDVRERMSGALGTPPELAAAPLPVCRRLCPGAVARFT
jgi:hypothetical protein